MLTMLYRFLKGALYPDGTSGRNKNDDMVPPGKNYTYVWPVREEYAPAPADANCLTWVYHSHIDAPKDICSGLIGPLLVCKEGKEPLPPNTHTHRHTQKPIPRCVKKCFAYLPCSIWKMSLLPSIM